MTVSKDDPKITLLTGATALASGATPMTEKLTTSNAIQVGIEILCTFGAASKPGRLDVYGSFDDINYTTFPIGSYEMVLQASRVSRQEFAVVNFPPYLKFQLTNLDTTIDITAISIFAERQYVA